MEKKIEKIEVSSEVFWQVLMKLDGFSLNMRNYNDYEKPFGIVRNGDHYQEIYIKNGKTN